MKIMVWIGNEGPTDQDMKDGDVWAVYPDTWTPGIEETKKWLVVQTEDYNGDVLELVRSEYGQGPSPDEPQIVHMRKYYIDYATKLTPEELLLVRDKNADFPVCVGRFILDDIHRK